MKSRYAPAFVSTAVIAVIAGAWGGLPEGFPAAAAPVSSVTGATSPLSTVTAPAAPVPVPTAPPAPVPPAPTAAPTGPPPPPTIAPRLDWAAGDVLVERDFACTEEWSGATFAQRVKFGIRAGRRGDVAVQMSAEAELAITALSPGHPLEVRPSVDVRWGDRETRLSLGSQVFEDGSLPITFNSGGETMVVAAEDKLAITVESLRFQLSGDPATQQLWRYIDCEPVKVEPAIAVSVRRTGKAVLTVTTAIDHVSRSVTFRARVPDGMAGSTLSVYLGKPSIGLVVGGRRTIVLDADGAAQWTVPGLWGAGRYIYEITPTGDPWLLVDRVTRRLEMEKNSVSASSSVATKKLSRKRSRVTTTGRVSSTTPLRPDGKVVVQILRGKRQVDRTVVALDSSGRYRVRASIPRVAGKYRVKVSCRGSKNFLPQAVRERAFRVR